MLSQLPAALPPPHPEAEAYGRAGPGGICACPASSSPPLLQMLPTALSHRSACGGEMHDGPKGSHANVCTSLRGSAGWGQINTGSETTRMQVPTVPPAPGLCSTGAELSWPKCPPPHLLSPELCSLKLAVHRPPWSRGHLTQATCKLLPVLSPPTGSGVGQPGYQTWFLQSPPGEPSVRLTSPELLNPHHDTMTRIWWIIRRGGQRTPNSWRTVGAR